MFNDYHGIIVYNYHWNISENDIVNIEVFEWLTILTCFYWWSYTDYDNPLILIIVMETWHDDSIMDNYRFSSDEHTSIMA